MYIKHVHACSVTKWCPLLCNSMDCSPPGSCVHEISQARTLEWVVISFSRGSSWPRYQTRVSCIDTQTQKYWIFITPETQVTLFLKDNDYPDFQQKIMCLFFQIESYSMCSFISGFFCCMCSVFSIVAVPFSFLYMPLYKEITHLSTSLLSGIWVVSKFGILWITLLSIFFSTCFTKYTCAFLLGIYNSGTVGSMDMHISKFVRYWQIFFQSRCPTYTLIRSIWKLDFSISLAIILHIFNLFSCILGNTYIIDLIWISVVTNEVVHLSIGLLGIFIFTFMKVIKKSLVPSWVLNPFSLIYRYFSHILDTLLCQLYGL